MKISEHLREAFLNGREIIGYQFAKEIGTTGSSISKAMRAFGAMVEGREEPNTKSNLTHIKVWRCVDLEAMTKWRAPQSGPVVEAAQEMQANALAELWGMRVVDIPLPTRTFRLLGEAA